MMRMVSNASCLISSIGAMNWGFAAFLNFDLVDYIAMMVGIGGLDKLLYGVVALSGAYVFISFCTGRICCQ